MPTYHIGTAFWPGAGAQSLTPSSGADDTSSWTRTLSMGVRPVQESAAGGRSYEQAAGAVTPAVAQQIALSAHSEMHEKLDRMLAQVDVDFRGAGRARSELA